jgi:hypothetical protein
VSELAVSADELGIPVTRFIPNLGSLNSFDVAVFPTSLKNDSHVSLAAIAPEPPMVARECRDEFTFIR